MKLLWTDVKELFQECTVWAHRQEMAWFEQVWRIFDQKGLTLWNSTAEKIAVYNRIYGTIWIFRNFCMAGFEEDAHFDFYWESSFQPLLQKAEENDDAETERIYGELICDEQVICTIFEILKDHMGTAQLFASLWATCRPEVIANEADSFDEDLSAILNEAPESEKLAAYAWLSDYLE